jgi:hypothetical protein
MAPCVNHAHGMGHFGASIFTAGKSSGCGWQDDAACRPRRQSRQALKLSVGTCQDIEHFENRARFCKSSKKSFRTVNMSQIAVQRGLSIYATVRGPILLAQSRCTSPRGVRFLGSLPRIATPSFWRSLVPKPFRSTGVDREKKPVSKEWNPATFFIVIFLLIGSQSIHLLVLKNEFAAFIRQSEVRIGLLREVVEKLQKGEEVDVERVLGTGDPKKEVEWQEGWFSSGRRSRAVLADTPP